MMSSKLFSNLVSCDLCAALHQLTDWLCTDKGGGAAKHDYAPSGNKNPEIEEASSGTLHRLPFLNYPLTRTLLCCVYANYLTPSHIQHWSHWSEPVIHWTHHELLSTGIFSSEKDKIHKMGMIVHFIHFQTAIRHWLGVISWMVQISCPCWHVCCFWAGHMICALSTIHGLKILYHFVS